MYLLHIKITATPTAINTTITREIETAMTVNDTGNLSSDIENIFINTCTCIYILVNMCVCNLRYDIFRDLYVEKSNF